MHRMQSLRSRLQRMEPEFLRTDSISPAIPTTTPTALALQPGGTSCFWSSQPALGPQITGTKDPFRWQFLSDVCKHCGNAGCLEACPTGAIIRTEIGSVYVQPDVCNGCGYCVVSCPFGVVDKNHEVGTAFKCTFCYDRQRAGACARVCQGLPNPVDPIRRHRGLTDMRPSCGSSSCNNADTATRKSITRKRRASAARMRCL